MRHRPAGEGVNEKQPVIVIKEAVYGVQNDPSKQVDVKQKIQAAISAQVSSVRRLLPLSSIWEGGKRLGKDRRRFDRLSPGAAEYDRDVYRSGRGWGSARVRR